MKIVRSNFIVLIMRLLLLVILILVLNVKKIQRKSALIKTHVKISVILEGFVLINNVLVSTGIQDIFVKMNVMDLEKKINA